MLKTKKVIQLECRCGFKIIDDEDESHYSSSVEEFIAECKGKNIGFSVKEGSFVCPCCGREYTFDFNFYLTNLEYAGEIIRPEKCENCELGDEENWPCQCFDQKTKKCVREQ